MPLIQTKCMFKKNFIIQYQTPLPSFFEKLNFISKILHFTMQVVVYQEGTKINTEVNERVLKIIDTH